MLTVEDRLKLAKMLQNDEGFRGYAYDDATGKAVLAPVGRLTIGYGRNIQDRPLTMEMCQAILKEDILLCEEELKSRFAIVYLLDPVRKIVLCNMCFNLGITKLSQFKKMWMALAKLDFKSASEEILNSAAAKQLPKRYESLAQMMATGKFPGGIYS